MLTAYADAALTTLRYAVHREVLLAYIRESERLFDSSADERTYPKVPSSHLNTFRAAIEVFMPPGSAFASPP